MRPHLRATWWHHHQTRRRPHAAGLSAAARTIASATSAPATATVAANWPEPRWELRDAFDKGRGSTLTRLGDATGLFGIDGLQRPSDLQAMAHRARATVAEIEKAVLAEAANPSPKTMRQFDDISEAATSVADLAQVLVHVHPDPAFSRMAQSVYIEMSTVLQTLNVNVQLAKIVDRIVSDGSVRSRLSSEELACALLLQSDFQNSGIHKTPQLPEAKKATFVAATEKIHRISTALFENPPVQQLVIPAATIATTKGPLRDLLPSLHIDLRGRATVPLNAGILSMILRTVHDEDIRKQAYDAAYIADPAQLRLLDQLLATRDDVAKLVGYPSYAALFLSDKMAGTPDYVLGFLKTLGETLRPGCERNIQKLHQVKRELNPRCKNDYVAQWDKAYLMNEITDKIFKVSSSSLRPFFSLGSCMAGLDMLTRSLYGLELRLVPTRPGEVWSSSVLRLDVVDMACNEPIGHIYCDFEPRETKFASAAHFTVRCSKRITESSMQLPVIVLSCNFDVHPKNEPTLLEPSEVETLFHEMGHAMHTMIARTDMHMIAGTRCKVDFVETPSILMEYFANDPRIVSKFARHYKTNAPLPLDAFKRYVESRKVFAPLQTQTQVVFSLMDQLFHGSHPLQSSTTDILTNLEENYLGIPPARNTAWQTQFNHLMGYGAGYYSYQHCHVFAAHIWNKLFEANPLSRETGERYRSMVLSHGGGKDPHDMLRDLLGEEPSPEHYLRNLGVYK